MPCTCRGIRYKKCSCNILRSGPWGPDPVPVHDDCVRQQVVSLKTWLTRTIEGFYERCAAYNLRYCPYRTFRGSKNSVLRTLKDFLVLICFFMANFVVFLIIMTRIAMHMTCAIVESGDWIRRSVYTPDAGYVTLSNCPECSPPRKPACF